MGEVEKGLIKEKYGRIGKEEVDGLVVDETETLEDIKMEECARWLEKKTSLVYDLEDNSLNFGRCKATNMKGNKRIHLPKAGSPSLEAFLEIRRQEASRIFDQCVALLGENAGWDNLDHEEKLGIKRLQKRVKNGEIVVCQTDKSGRFSILTREQYVKAGEKHTSKDREVNDTESAQIERNLNGHMRWWAWMTNLGSEWKNEDRCVRNLLNHGLAVCPMTLSIKDHKSWSVESGETPPTRSVMGGNVGMNRGISEYLSIILEPVARKQKGMEVNSTSGFISVIEGINGKNMNKSGKPEKGSEGPILQDDKSESEVDNTDDTNLVNSSHQEGIHDKDTCSEEQTCNSVDHASTENTKTALESEDEENIPTGQKPETVDTDEKVPKELENVVTIEDLVPEDTDDMLTGWKQTEQNETDGFIRSDIRRYLSKNCREEIIMNKKDVPDCQEDRFLLFIAFLLFYTHTTSSGSEYSSPGQFTLTICSFIYPCAKL